MKSTTPTKTIPAKQIKVGDRIRTLDGADLAVQSISIGTFPGHLSMALEGGDTTHLPAAMPVEVVVEG